MSDFTVTIRPKLTKLQIKVDLPYALLTRLVGWVVFALIALTLYADTGR